MASRFPRVDQEPAAVTPQAHHVRIFAPAHSVGALPERRIALLIGNATNDIPNPVKDVRLLADVLASLGFEVTRTENADSATLRQSLCEFASELDRLGEEVVALFYFAGHGFQDAGVNFLLPVDASMTSRAFLPARSLALDDVVSSLARTKRKATVVVVDACRRPPDSIDVASRDVTQGLAGLTLRPEAMLVVYSTAAGAVADDGDIDAGNGPYAAALAQALPGLLKPDCKLHDVFVEAAERVRATTNGTQNPALYLQGALPPLNVTDADRRRFEQWDFKRPLSMRERALQWLGTGAVAASLVVSAIVWWSAYPETRGQWLHQIGMRDEQYEFNCMKEVGPDRFGLTRAEWCLYPVDHLVGLARERKRWDVSEAQRFADSGDIAAMTLLAAESRRSFENPWARSRIVVDGPSYEMRAARAGWLPAWAPAAQFDDGKRARETIAEVRFGLERAAAANVIPAQVERGIDLWTNGNIVGAEAIFADVRERGGDALATLRIGELFLTGSPAARFPADVPRALPLLAKACELGQTRGLSHLVRIDADLLFEQAGASLAPCLKRVATKVRQLNSVSFDALVGRYYSYNDTVTTSHAEDVTLARMIALGLPDRDGRPRIEPDGETAHIILYRQIRYGSQVLNDFPDQRQVAASAARTLIELMEVGAISETQSESKRELAWLIQKISKDEATLKFAADVLDRDKTLSDLAPRACAPTKEFSYRVWRAAQQEMGPGSDEATISDAEAEDLWCDSLHSRIELGGKAAPVQIDVLLPWGCVTCADWLARILPLLTADYVSSGIARLVARPMAPDGVGAQAVDAEQVMRCSPMSRRLELYIRLMATFPAWSVLPEAARRDQLQLWATMPTAVIRSRCLSSWSTHSDTIAQLLEQYRPPVELRDSDMEARMARNQQDSMAREAARFGAAIEPVVYVNGRRLAAADLEGVRAAIESVTPPDIRWRQANAR